MADPASPGSSTCPDTVTRMIYSVMLTGVAPGSFYQRDAAGHRQRAHFDGLPVGFVAEAVTTLGAEAEEGFVTYHVMNPHDDGIGIDEYVDWLIEAGYPIERVEDFGEWVQRFEDGLRVLPERQAQNTVLPLLLAVRRVPWTSSRRNPRSGPRLPPSGSGPRSARPESVRR